MIRLVFILLLGTVLNGCAIRYSDYAHGKIWCNDRYLHDLPEPFDEKHLKMAKQGYMYSLAAALVLQKKGENDREHYFPTPNRLELIDKPERHDSGFEVGTYKLYDPGKQRVKEIIIAFTGSNDRDDWVWTNLLLSKKQYNLAVEYVKKIDKFAKKNNIERIVAVGYSLGGALAVHTVKNPETKNMIDEVWALNPSPKTYSHGDNNPRIWMAATKEDALRVLRKPYFRVLPGVSKIGAYDEQTADEYNLVESNKIYGHFRWVLTRNMLHAADLKIYNETGSEITEPLEILKGSYFEACNS